MNVQVILKGCCAVAFLIIPGLSSGQDYLMYEPKAATGAEGTPAPGKGVLVKSVTVQRGDTLKKIARRYIGKDWLFPQVLLFNKVKDPDLIHPGERLLVPVSASKAAENHKKKAPSKKHVKEAAKRKKAAKRSPVPVAKPAPAAEVGAVPTPPPVPEVKKAEAKERAGKEKARKGRRATRPVEATAADGQALYQQARKAYIQGNYRRAAALFTEYLDRHGNSLLAADAALYRADCYLQLSEQ